MLNYSVIFQFDTFIIEFVDFYAGLYEASIPWVIMVHATERDEVGVLLLTEHLYKLRSACAFALVQGRKETLELVTEGIQRFDVNAVFSLTSVGHQKLDSQLVPIGPYHFLDTVRIGFDESFYFH